MKEMLVKYAVDIIDAQSAGSISQGKIIAPLTPELLRAIADKLRNSPVQSLDVIADGLDIRIKKSLPIIGAVCIKICIRTLVIHRDGSAITLRFRLDSHRYFKYLVYLLDSKLTASQLAVEISDNIWTIDISRKAAGLFGKSWGAAEILKPYVEKMFLSTAIKVHLEDQKIVFQPLLKLSDNQKGVLLDFVNAATAKRACSDLQ